MVLNALRGISTPPIQIANNIWGSLSEIYQFRSVQFLHVPRSRNKASRALAQYARDIPNFISWIEETPCIDEHLVSQDVMFLSSSKWNSDFHIKKNN